MIFKNKMAGIDFRFIARNPPALLIAGGILLFIIGDENNAQMLIIIGVILQLLYLKGIKLI